MKVTCPNYKKPWTVNKSAQSAALKRFCGWESPRGRCSIFAWVLFLAADRQAGEEHFRAGYSEAVSEAVRFLVEVRGYSPSDRLCMQMTSHMQRHVDAVTKGKNSLDVISNSGSAKRKNLYVLVYPTPGIVRCCMSKKPSETCDHQKPGRHLSPCTSTMTLASELKPCSPPANVVALNRSSRNNLSVC